MKLVNKLSRLFQAMQNCENSGNSEWKHRHADNIYDLVEKYLPSGSGFDNGTFLDLNESHAEKLVFKTSFHHMDENGFYTMWTMHSVTVKSSLLHGFVLKVSGQNLNDIKDYISDMFYECLNTEVE